MTTFVYLQRRHAEMKARLAEFSGLDQDLIENVIQYGRNLAHPGTSDITNNVFTAQMMSQFQISNYNMVFQMFDALTRKRRTQLNKEMPVVSRFVSVEDYCWLVCVFLTRNLNVKIEWVFSVYDTNGDGELSKLEMYLLLKPCVLHTEDMDIEEAVKELVDIVISVFDIDKSGAIDLEEFRSLVKRNVLYIDLLGQCLPGESAVKMFLKKIEGKSSMQVSQMFVNERIRTSMAPRYKKEDSLYPIHLDMPISKTKPTSSRNSFVIELPRLVCA